MNRLALSLIAGFCLILFPMSIANAYTLGENGGIAEVLDGGNAEDKKYKSVRLTPEIYNNGDIRGIIVKNGESAVVPYFINSQENFSNEVSQTYEMKNVDAFVDGDWFYFDFKVNIPTNGHTNDISATGIETAFSRPEKLFKFTLFGSYDGKNWTEIQEDIFYNVQGNIKNSLEFAKPQKFIYYRFKKVKTVDGLNAEKAILSDGMKLYNKENYSERYNFEESFVPEFNVRQIEKNTEIDLQGLRNLKVSKITVETDSIFKRKFRVKDYNNTVYGRYFELYNLNFNNNAVTNATMENINTEISGIIIENNDDSPIDIKGITVYYYADDLVFEGGGESYTIEFDFKRQYPVYDIVSYKDEILKGEIERLEISSVKINEPSVPKPKDYKMIFNIVIGGVGLLLAVLILAGLRKS